MEETRNMNTALQKEVQFLRTLFGSLSMDHARETHNWFPDGFEMEIDDKEDLNSTNARGGVCRFTGIGCDPDGRVTLIDLTNFGLKGSLPDNFWALEYLEQLFLRNNFITGSLPSRLPGTLRHFNVDQNRLQGNIPSFIFSDDHLKGNNTIRLQRLILSANDLEGSVPSSLCRLENLRALNLSRNQQLQGTLPACLGENLPDLVGLQVHSTSLIGPLSPQLCRKISVQNEKETAEKEAGHCTRFNFCRNGYKEVRRGPVGVSAPVDCIPCAKPSNVLSSSTCRWIPAIETPGPSPPPLAALKTPQPVLPTVVPSIYPTFEPSRASLSATPSTTSRPMVTTTTTVPTYKPSFSPTLAFLEVPSQLPSPFPSFVPSEAALNPVTDVATPIPSQLMPNHIPTSAYPSVSLQPSQLGISPIFPTTQAPLGIDQLETESRGVLNGGPNRPGRDLSGTRILWTVLFSASIFVAVAFLLVVPRVLGNRRSDQGGVPFRSLHESGDLCSTRSGLDCEAASASPSDGKVAKDELDQESRRLSENCCQTQQFVINGSDSRFTFRSCIVQPQTLAANPKVRFLIQARPLDSSNDSQGTDEKSIESTTDEKPVRVREDIIKQVSIATPEYTSMSSDMTRKKMAAKENLKTYRIQDETVSKSFSSKLASIFRETGVVPSKTDTKMESKFATGNWTEILPSNAYLAQRSSSCHSFPTDSSSASTTTPMLNPIDQYLPRTELMLRTFSAPVTRTCIPLHPTTTNSSWMDDSIFDDGSDIMPSGGVNMSNSLEIPIPDYCSRSDTNKVGKHNLSSNASPFDRLIYESDDSEQTIVPVLGIRAKQCQSRSGYKGNDRSTEVIGFSSRNHRLLGGTEADW